MGHCRAFRGTPFGTGNNTRKASFPKMFSAREVSSFENRTARLSVSSPQNRRYFLAFFRGAEASTRQVRGAFLTRKPLKKGKARNIWDFMPPCFSSYFSSFNNSHHGLDLLQVDLASLASGASFFMKI